jgi:hypothetical protein
MFSLLPDDMKIFKNLMSGWDVSLPWAIEKPKFYCKTLEKRASKSNSDQLDQKKTRQVNTTCKFALR